MPLLSVKNLRTHFATDRGVVRAVDGVSFTLEPGEVLGLVGESGSGKSVTALSIMRLIREPPGKITADELMFDGTDLLALSERQLLDIRTARIAMVFQDPMRSLNPVLTVGRQLIETLRRHLGLEGKAARRRAVELLDMVGIPSAKARLGAYGGFRPGDRVNVTVRGGALAYPHEQ
jgi:ABC-type dipeptide/oligopeptide/nickel transport system ATPase component